MSEKRSRRQQGGEGTRSGGGSGNKKAKKMLVMDASGQTTEERRELRLKQRALKSKIIQQESDLGDLGKDNFRELTEANGKLFESTNFPREAATDSTNMMLLGKSGEKQSDQVNSGSIRVNVDHTLDSVNKFFSQAKGEDGDGTKVFNWAKWGGNISMVFLALPEGSNFMMGPLDKPAKERKAAQRRQKITDDDAEEVTPEMEQQGRKAKVNKDQTQMRIVKLKETECTKEKARVKKDMFETLINPKSFTQTVENFFDFSFFVKSSQGHIVIDEETKLPQVMFEQESMQSGAADQVANKQWLMSFTPEDFRELAALYEMEEPNIAHRNEGPKSDYYDPLVHGNRESNRQ